MLFTEPRAAAHDVISFELRSRSNLVDTNGTDVSDVHVQRVARSFTELQPVKSFNYLQDHTPNANPPVDAPQRNARRQ